MTVSAQTPINRSTGNGVTTVFPYTFKIIAAGDIEVSLDDVVKTLNVDYTVSGAGDDAGGNVTMTTAPASGVTVVRRRNMAIVRTTDYQDQGTLPAATLDSDIDATVLMAQQLNERLDRTFSLPTSSSADNAMPAPQAGYVLGWDALGESLTNLPATVGTSLIDLAESSGSSLVGYLPAGTGAVATTVQSKLRESVSVLDFGAVGDGVTDDTAALQLALNTGKNVKLPSEYVFLQADTLNMTIADQTVYGGGKLKQTTNNRANILVTANNALIKKILFENTGTATGTGISANPKYYGSAVILKDCVGSKVVKCKTTNCSSIATAYGAAIWLTGAQDCEVSGNYIDGAFHGINTDHYYAVNPSKNNYIHGNTMKNIQNGYVLDLQGTPRANSEGDKFVNNTVYEPVDSGVIIDDSENGALISGNNLVGSLTKTGSTGIKLVHHANLVKITDNKIRKFEGIGIAINGVDGTVPTDNSISGNTITENGQDGIQIYTVQRLRITKNTIVKNGRCGIASVTANYPRAITIIDNTICENANDGISLIDCNVINIADNEIYGNSTAAVNTYSGIKLKSVNIALSGIKIHTNNFFLSFPGYTEKQKYAINLDTWGLASSSRSGNTYGTQLTASVNDPGFLFNGMMDGDTTQSAWLNINGTNVYQSPTIPTAGAYTAGQRVLNSNATVLGTAGSKYVIEGWYRLTTGSAHVLNTDWVELRTLTGT